MAWQIILTVHFFLLSLVKHKRFIRTVNNINITHFVVFSNKKESKPYRLWAYNKHSIHIC